MNILAIIAGIPVLVALYGVIRRQRFFFLLGYLLYALIVVPNELGEYMATGSMERLAVAVVWILQAILAFPNKLNYDGSKVFKSFGIKTFLSLAAINIFGVVLTRVMPTPPEFTEGLRTMIGVKLMKHIKRKKHSLLCRWLNVVVLVLSRISIADFDRTILRS